jgi:hypothetical protein
MTPNRAIFAAALLLCSGNVSAVGQQAQSPADPRPALVARGKEFELPGTWNPPPGNALEHHTAGFAKTLCSAVFLTGLDPKDAAANVGFFTGPVQYRSAVVDTVVDRSRQEVRLRLASGVTRVARRFGSQGSLRCPRQGLVFARRWSPTSRRPGPPVAHGRRGARGPGRNRFAAFAAAMATGFGPRRP